MNMVHGFPPIIEGAFYEGSPFDLLARVRDDTGNPATTNSFDSCTYHIYESPDKVTELSNGSLVIGDVFHDTLQTGPKWNRDSEGYNFEWNISTSKLPLAGEAIYWIEVIFLKVAVRTPLTARVYQYPLKSAPTPT